MPTQLTTQEILAQDYFYHVSPRVNEESILEGGLRVEQKHDHQDDKRIEPQVHLYSRHGLKNGLLVVSSKIGRGELTIFRITSTALSELRICFDQEDDLTVQMMNACEDHVTLLQYGAAIACFDSIPEHAITITGHFNAQNWLDLKRGAIDLGQFE